MLIKEKNLLHMILTLADAFKVMIGAEGIANHIHFLGVN